MLQKQATRNLPRLVLNRQTVLLYLRSGLWVTGTLTDLGGALLMIVAFAYAPVSRAGCHGWQQQCCGLWAVGCSLASRKVACVQAGRSAGVTFALASTAGPCL